MMKYRFFLLIASNFLTCFYAYSQQPKVKFQIHGEIKGLRNYSIVLGIPKFDANGKRSGMDTLVATGVNDRFSIKGSSENPQLVWVTVGGLRSRKSFSFFIENGNISVKGHIDSLDIISVTGTFSNNDQTQSRKVTGEIYTRIKFNQQQLKNHEKGSEEYKWLMATIGEKYDSIEKYEEQFIQTHPNSLMSGTYIYVKQDKLPIELLETLYNNLSPDVKKLGLILNVPDKIKARKFVAIGNMAPDFTSTDTSGNRVNFADFRGKYVLLEFWAHWCVPCRAEHPNLRETYKKYNEKGFTILQYSIDEKNAEARWKEAIRKDELVWTQASDLSGFDSKVSRLYGVQPIPDNFLIDPNGKIIARRLRGEELDKKLAELLGGK